MARLVTLSCPRCGAHLEAEEGADRITCKYCKTTSMLRATQAMPAARPSSGGKGAGLALLVLLVPIGLCVAGAAFFVVMRAAPSGPPPSPASVAPVSMPVPTPAIPMPPTPVEPPPPPAAPVVHVLESAPMFVADADADGRNELIAPISSELSGETTTHWAVFDTQTGAERARTPAIERLDQAMPALVASARRLVLATRDGQLIGYDLGSGAQQWNTTLGERVASICAVRTEGSVEVLTDAARKLLVDLTTGRQTETREACTTMLARNELAESSDRRDDSAPAGIEAYQCGSVHVMTGSGSGTIPDACRARAHVDSDRLDGMVGHRVWKHGDGWLVFGVRVPGRYVPKVGLIGRSHRLEWSQDVPLVNPLDAEQGGPRNVGLAGETLVVAYETESDRATHVTSFQASTGQRGWTVTLGPDVDVSQIIGTDDAAILRMDHVVRVMNASDGATRVTIGTP